MGMSEGGVTAVEEALRLHPTWINGGGDLPGPGGAVIAAMLAVATGLCRHVLCFRTVWESTFATLGLRPARGGGRASGWQEWRAPFGAMSAANWIGMNANQYLHRYGATRELLGLIALNGRANAARNPVAIYRDPMTMDDYLSARPITSPFGLYDCDVPCDGSIAVIVSDAVGRPPTCPTRRSASRRSAPRSSSGSRGTRARSPTSRRCSGQAAHLWTRTSLRPSDVDVALLYDGFTFNAVSWLEGTRLLRRSARPRTGSTAAAASPSTASSRSTRTAASSPRGGPTGSASSTRRSPSSATTPASARWTAPPRPW